MNELENLKKEIEGLKQWKASLESSSSIPLNIDRAFRERLFGLSGTIVPTGTGTPGGQSVFSAFDVTVPANPSGTLKVIFNGTTYELLYK